MDDQAFHEQLASISCMVQALTDQVSAAQRDHPASVRPSRRPEPDGSTDAVVTELVMLVLRLQRDLDDVKAQLRTEIRTGRIVVEDGDRQVRISPGEIMVERRATTGDARSGSSVHIQSLIRGAEVRVGAAFQGRDDPGVAAIVNANWEGRIPCALLSAQSDALDGDGVQEELRVEGRSAASDCTDG